jgi:pimeloyl-ACP methyl ester carboxylesterase
MYFYEAGPLSAPTVVLLHGGGMGGWSWQPEIERLQDHHLLVPDLPGQGKSLSEGPFTFLAAASKVAELIRRCAHGGKAHVAGLSLGAQTLIHLLSVAPEVVASAFATGTLAHKLPGASLVRPTLALYNPIKNAPFMVRANMWSFGVPKEYYDKFALDTRDASVDSMAAIFKANMTFEMPTGLDRVAAPVLLAVGEQEYGMMKQSAQRLAAAIPGAKAYAVKGGGHNWPLTQPDLYTRTLRAWLAGANLPVELTPLS